MEGGFGVGDDLDVRGGQRIPIRSLGGPQVDGTEPAGPQPLEKIGGASAPGGGHPLLGPRNSAWRQQDDGGDWARGWRRHRRSSGRPR
jgi:hypothetical protein